MKNFFLLLIIFALGCQVTIGCQKESACDPELKRTCTLTQFGYVTCPPDWHVQIDTIVSITTVSDCKVDWYLNEIQETNAAFLIALKKDDPEGYEFYKDHPATCNCE